MSASATLSRQMSVTLCSHARKWAQARLAARALVHVNATACMAHVRYKDNACFRYDTGTLVINGRPAPCRIEHDRPSSEVEEMGARPRCPLAAE